MPYFRKTLNFKYDALEPFIDGETIKVHYEEHHKGYEDKLNLAVKGKNLEEKYKTIEDLMKHYQEIEDSELKIKIREFGGGLINHNFFWNILKKDSEPLSEDSELLKKINETWNSLEEFKKEFKKEALSLFGSGWVWLVKRTKGDLKIIKTFNQDNPWFLKFTPIIGIDLWEHAYYLKHHGDRSSYFDDFWNLINWEEVNKKYEED